MSKLYLLPSSGLSWLNVTCSEEHCETCHVDFGAREAAETVRVVHDMALRSERERERERKGEGEGEGTERDLATDPRKTKRGEGARKRENEETHKAERARIEHGSTSGQSTRAGSRPTTPAITTCKEPL